MSVCGEDGILPRPEGKGIPLGCSSHRFGTPQDRSPVRVPPGDSGRAQGAGPKRAAVHRQARGNFPPHGRRPRRGIAPRCISGPRARARRGIARGPPGGGARTPVLPLSSGTGGRLEVFLLTIVKDTRIRCPYCALQFSSLRPGGSQGVVVLPAAPKRPTWRRP